MIARILAWLRVSAAWLLAVAVAVLLIAWLWRAYRAADARADEAERREAAAESRARSAERAADAHAKRAAISEVARISLEKRYAELHAATQREAERLVRVRDAIRATGGAELAREFDAEFGAGGPPAPPQAPAESPGAEAREKWWGP
jgi:hypothetical protein